MLAILKGTILAVMLAQVTASSGCSSPSSEDIQNANQENSNKQAVETVGFPAINRFAEKRLLKMVYELRDQDVPTVTYTQDLNGHYHKVCDSFGYPLPYSTQFSNPEQPSGAEYALPQADPNGLYSPPEAEGTWILCYNRNNKKSEPVYEEPRVATFPADMPQPKE